MLSTKTLPETPALAKYPTLLCSSRTAWTTMATEVAAALYVVACCGHGLTCRISHLT